MTTKKAKKPATKKSPPLRPSTKKSASTQVPGSPAPSGSSGKLRALLVGLTHIDPACHDGWDGRNGCTGCAADVMGLGTILEKRGWETDRMLDQKATVGNVLARLARLAGQAEAGDSIFFYYSGHGSQAQDGNEDEIDGLDETLVCFDGHLVDDQLNQIWLSCKTGVRIYMIADSCNSGTSYKAVPLSPGIPSNKLRVRQRPVSTATDLLTSSGVMSANLLHLGGCRDGSVSIGVADGGVFTKAIVKVVESGFTGTWKELYKKVVPMVSESQDASFNLYPEEGNTLGDEPCFSPGRLVLPAKPCVRAVPETTKAIPVEAQSVSTDSSFPVPEGEEMLRRIDLAIAAREAANRTGARAKGIPLVAEGDSWFDFKIRPDVIDWLERDYNYDIENVAAAGGCVYEMAYGPDNDSLWDAFGRDASQLEEVVRKIRQHRPRAFLFSGTGNDFVGPEFILAIHHAGARKSGVNQRVVDALFEDDVEPGIRRVLETAIAAARGAGLGSIPVILHGYDYAFPDGRSAVNLGIKKVGPWMHPSFAMKGYPYRDDDDLTVRRRLVMAMIDSVYAMLNRIKSSYPNIHIVDVRGTLPSRSDWHDELHPTGEGFRKVARLFHQVISAALDPRQAIPDSRSVPTLP
jgi:hypothetical protein